MNITIDTSIYKDGELMSLGLIEISVTGDSITHEIANQASILINQMLEEYRRN